MEKQTTKYVAYLRVSTHKQGFSGLGLEAQKEIIQKHLRDITPIAEYTEVESGRKTDKGRPQLRKALEHCRKEGAILIVAKLDRLARNVFFLSSLLENDVEIVFCDFPQANKMVLHILAAISQYEAELIATRTRRQRKQGELNLVILSIFLINMKKLWQTATEQTRKRRKLIPTTKEPLHF